MAATAGLTVVLVGLKVVEKTVTGRVAHGEIVGEGVDRGGFVLGTPKAEFRRERNAGMTGSLKEGLCAQEKMF